MNAGVDVFYAEALPNHDEIREVREAFRDVPLVITIRPPLTQTQAREMGVCTTFLHIARVGAVAMWDLLVDQQQRGSIAWHEFLAKTEHHPLGGFGLFDLTGFPELIELEKKYLPKEKLERYNSSLGLYDPRTRGSGSARGGQNFSRRAAKQTHCVCKGVCPDHAIESPNLLVSDHRRSTSALIVPSTA